MVKEDGAGCAVRCGTGQCGEANYGLPAKKSPVIH
jgi:hypothetical protein